MNEYPKQLAIEAVSVGAAFVPFQYIVSGLVARSAIAPRYQPWVSIFLAGAGFHLVAEATGLNNWYLHHSAASMRDFAVWAKRVKNMPQQKKECGLRWCGE